MSDQTQDVSAKAPKPTLQEMSAEATAEMSAEDKAAYMEFHSFENFTKMHKSQFEAMKLPKFLWKVVHRKIYTGDFDMCDFFTMDHEGEDGWKITNNVNQRKWADVWVIPHIFSSPKELVKKKLREDADTVDRLWKLMDMENLILDPAEVEANAERKQALAAAVEIDESMLDVIISATGVDLAKARKALVDAKGDLIEAIQLCSERTEIDELSDKLDKQLSDLYQGANIKDPKTLGGEEKKEEGGEAVTAAAGKAPETEEEKFEQKVCTVYEAMFKHKYAQQYMLMKPREEGSKFTGPIQEEEIIKVQYVMDEYGSAIRFSPEPNGLLFHFVCLTLDHTAFSLFWFNKDCKPSELVTRPILA